MIFIGLLGSNAAVAELCPDIILQQTVELTPAVNGWGLDRKNSRFVRSEKAGINRKNVKTMVVDWVFGLPDTKMPHAQPMVTTNTVYIGDERGVVFALDRLTGCTRWTFAAEASIRTAIRLIKPPAPEGKQAQALLVFGDASAFVYAIDAQTGALVWRLKADSHSKAMISGSPAYAHGRVFIPVSSWEAFWAANPLYTCCTFRSSVLALDAVSGEEIWRTYTIEQPSQKVKERWLLPDLWGPSGAPVWSAPTIDLERNVLYVGTGENYSSPATDMSDAIIAMDLETGEIKWSRQFLANDAWNVSCEVFISSNCPEERGVDLDFGAPPILSRYKGRSYLLAGQKNGQLYALDPDAEGATLWSKKMGRGGKLGGIHFGMAVDRKSGTLYVPVSDRKVEALGGAEQGEPAAGLSALELSTGDAKWFQAAEACEKGDECFTGFSAAITVTEELVFAASLDGVLHVFDTKTGERSWRFDTARNFETVNGVAAHGGAIDLGGVYVNSGQLFVSSGYEVFDQQGGNAFLVMRSDPVVASPDKSSETGNADAERQSESPVIEQN